MGESILYSFGISPLDSEVSYRADFMPSEPTESELNHPILEGVPEEGEREIIAFLHCQANVIRGA